MEHSVQRDLALEFSNASAPNSQSMSMTSNSSRGRRGPGPHRKPPPPGSIKIGQKVVMRGIEHIHPSVIKYANTAATISSVPAHPITWYGLIMNDGKEVKLRSSSFDAVGVDPASYSRRARQQTNNINGGGVNNNQAAAMAQVQVQAQQAQLRAIQAQYIQMQQQAVNSALMAAMSQSGNGLPPIVATGSHTFEGQEEKLEMDDFQLHTQTRNNNNNNNNNNSNSNNSNNNSKSNNNTTNNRHSQPSSHPQLNNPQKLILMNQLAAGSTQAMMGMGVSPNSANAAAFMRAAMAAAGTIQAARAAGNDGQIHHTEEQKALLKNQFFMTFVNQMLDTGRLAPDMLQVENLNSLHQVWNMQQVTMLQKIAEAQTAMNGNNNNNNNNNSNNNNNNNNSNNLNGFDQRSMQDPRVALWLIQQQQQQQQVQQAHLQQRLAIMQAQQQQQNFQELRIPSQSQRQTENNQNHNNNEEDNVSNDNDDDNEDDDEENGHVGHLNRISSSSSSSENSSKNETNDDDDDHDNNLSINSASSNNNNNSNNNHHNHNQSSSNSNHLTINVDTESSPNLTRSSNHVNDFLSPNNNSSTTSSSTPSHSHHCHSLNGNYVLPSPAIADEFLSLMNQNVLTPRAIRPNSSPFPDSPSGRFLTPLSPINVNGRSAFSLMASPLNMNGTNSNSTPSMIGRLSSNSTAQTPHNATFMSAWLSGPSQSPSTSNSPRNSSTNNNNSNNNDRLTSMNSLTLPASLNNSSHVSSNHSNDRLSISSSLTGLISNLNSPGIFRSSFSFVNTPAQTPRFLSNNSLDTLLVQTPRSSAFLVNDSSQNGDSTRGLKRNRSVAGLGEGISLD